MRRTAKVRRIYIIHAYAFGYNSLIMRQFTPVEPIDYLVVGHLVRDLTPEGPRLGGTAAYSSLTAHALGLRVGVVTIWGSELPLDPLRPISITSYPSETSTTFENVTTPRGRVQYVHHIAPNIGLNLIPEQWRKAPIVHLGPIAQEIEPSLIRSISSSLIGLTPQGWLREWDTNGRIYPSEWPEASFVLQNAGAAVISEEDVGGDEDRIEEMAASCQIFAVTEADQGARIYWNGDIRHFRPPQVHELDATGAGDIFAAAFFIRLYTTRDPWEATRFATQLASISITRSGLDGIPTPEEVQTSLLEVL